MAIAGRCWSRDEEGRHTRTLHTSGPWLWRALVLAWQVQSATFSHDGLTLLTVSLDGEGKLW